jgi:hypothetical protein
MPQSRLIRMAVVAATAIVSSVAIATPALAAGDTAPPTAPYIIYAQGYFCGQLIVGWMRSTDNVTSQPQLRYEVFADGRPIGAAADMGNESGVWAWFQNDVLAPGSHTITVKAEDAAGHWSAPSNADVVTGYAC